MKDGFTAVRGEITDVRNDMKNGLKDARDEMAGINIRMEGIQGETAVVRHEINSGLACVRSEIASAGSERNKSISEIWNETKTLHADMNNNFMETKQTIVTLGRKIEDLTEKTDIQDTEINTLRNVK